MSDAQTSDTPTSDALAVLRRVFANDAVKVGAMYLAIVVVFWAFANHLGYGNTGTLELIRRVVLLAAVYGIVVLALNLHWGYAGLFNIGVAGFMAVGAYSVAMLSGTPGGSPPGLGLPLPIGILGGVLAATVIGLVAALPALRLKADYLAIVTVAISEIIRMTYNSPAFSDVTGGARGFGNLPANPARTLFYRNPPDPGSEPTAIGDTVFSFAADYGIREFAVVNTFYTVGVLVVLLGVYLLLERTGRSPYGRVLKAIREDETAAQSLGKDTQNFKVRAFALGCALMGLAGIVWYAMGPRASVTPVTFRPNITFYIFIALIVGGAGSNTGSVLGGALFASLLFEAPPLVRSIITDTFEVNANPGNLIEALVPISGGDLAPLAGFLLNNIDTLRFIGIGVLLVVLIQRRPEGMLGARKETAATIPLGEDTRPGDRQGAAPATADGGESDE